MNDNKKYCWICGLREADSAEHKYKKSDIKRLFGDGTINLVRVQDGVETFAQGPKSRVFKRNKNICHTCNTDFTQEYDRAYECFIDWVLKNEKILLKRRFINLEKVFDGKDITLWMNNLYKYFIKSFGCTISEFGVPIPDDLVNIFPLKKYETSFILTFAVNEAVFLYSKYRQYLSKHDLRFYDGDEDKKTFNYCTYRENVSWLSIHYWYKLFSPPGDYGSIWIADTPYIHLGSVKNPPDDLLREQLEILKNSEEQIDRDHYKSYIQYYKFWEENYFPNFEKILD